jgi:hypothetical protein
MAPHQHTSNQTVAERLATLEANYLHMDEKLDDVSRDTKTLLNYVEQSKGGWKTLVAVASIGGLVGGVLTKLGIPAKWF